MPEIRFLSIEAILALQANTIEVEGGSPGIRDMGLLESALAMPEAKFAGEFLHDGLIGMAAAYLFHLASNHAFVDGNKRIAVAACLVFLKLNGGALPDPHELERVTFDLASGELSKEELTEWLRQAVST